MKIFLFIFCTVLLAIVILQAYRIYSYGKISYKLVDATKPFSFKPRESRGRFLVLGDSLAVGVGAQSEETLSGRLHQDFPEVEIDNLAVSGGKIQDSLRSINQIKTGKKYDLTIIQIGANDIIRFTNKNRAITELRALLVMAHVLSNKVVLMTSGSVGYAPIFIEPLSSFYTYRSKSFFSSFEQIALETETTFVPLYVSRKDDPFSKNPDLYYAEDKFHPSGAGYGLWYEKLKFALKR